MPSLMILWIGQNDAKHLDPARFESGLRCLLGWCKEDNIRVILLSTSAHRDEQKMISLAKADQIIHRLSQEFSVGFVDVKTPMERVMDYNRTAEFPVEMFTSGSHLSELGNLLAADTVYEYLVK